MVHIKRHRAYGKLGSSRNWLWAAASPCLGMARLEIPSSQPSITVNMFGTTNGPGQNPKGFPGKVAPKGSQRARPKAKVGVKARMACPANSWAKPPGAASTQRKFALTITCRMQVAGTGNVRCATNAARSQVAHSLAAKATMAYGRIDWAALSQTSLNLKTCWLMPLDE